MTEDPGDSPAAAATPTRRGQQLSGRVLGGAAAATAVVAFGLGLGLAAIGRPTETVPSADVATTAAPASTSTTGPATTSTTIAIAPAPSLEPPAPPPTTSTTAPAPTTTQPPLPSTSIVTVPQTVASPPFVTVDYAQNAGGQILLQAGSTAQIRFTNVGGSLGQWFIQGSGYVFVIGPTNGTLQPGGTRLVSIQAAPEVPGGVVTEQITIVASGVGSITIPVRIVN